MLCYGYLGTKLRKKTEISKKMFIFYFDGLSIFTKGHAFSLRRPCLLKREHGIKGKKHARKREKALSNREKGTGLPDSGGRPH